MDNDKEYGMGDGMGDGMGYDGEDEQELTLTRWKLTKAVDVDGIANAFEGEPLKTAEEMREFYVDTMEVRTGNPYRSPIHELERACKTPRERNAMLLLGHRGCGKSTELNKMKLRLEEDGRPVCIIQCQERMPLLNQPEFSDILILMGDGLLSTAVKYQAEISEKILYDILTFWQPTEQEDADSFGVDINFKLPAVELAVKGLENVKKLFSRMKDNVKYNNTEIRKAYQRRLTGSYTEWRRLLRGLADSIWKKARKQPVIIFEGLDHMENLQEGRTLFFEHAGKLTDVSFPVIYTFPIALYYDNEFADMEHLFSQIKVLRMIKLHTEDGTPYPEGTAQLREIVEHRVKAGVIEDDALELMMEKCGGSLRDLFDAIRNAGEIASYRQSRTGQRQSITRKDAEQALNEVRSRLTRRIEGTDHNVLAEICKGNHRKIWNKDEYLSLIQGRAILEYTDERWFDVHPLVRDYLVKLGYVQ